MKKYDFFISYSSDNEEMVKNLVDELEKGGAKCWFAPRDGKGRYAKDIVNAIRDAKIFLLCLSSSVPASDQVLNEIDTTCRINGRPEEPTIQIEPLFIEESLETNAQEFDEIMYYVSRNNFIEPQNRSSAKSIAQEVLLKNKESLKIGTPQKREQTESKYFTNEKEVSRLAAQAKLTRKFDADIYKKIFDCYENPVILDVGCSTGNLLLDRLSDYSGTFQLIGIDKDPALIEFANKNYKKENVEFVSCDVSKKNFDKDLHDVMHRMLIDKFDIIHISMLLLHLKAETATALLRRLRRLLKPGGTLIIKEIDDGLNYAYPDEKNMFERIYRICELDETTGNRKSGREIYYDLVRAGYDDISLIKSGFPTIGLTYEEKEVFWKIYFEFIRDDTHWMLKQYPEDSAIATEYKWYTENYEDIFDHFMDNDFVFSLGLQLYLAKI